MLQIGSIGERIHARIGDLWWYAILLFVAQRIGDVINMFVGLWLVPKYVPAQELGAVVPLTQFVSLIGLPLGILAIPFMKFLGIYAERGEFGKVKSLLRDVFVGTGLLAIVTLLLAWLVLPLLFERCRVATGSLGFLIVLSSIVGSVSTIFGNAVQGLKLFKATVWFNILCAPVRMGVMLLTMPFRALSGYFAGQTASSGVPVIGAIWVLRRRLGADVKALPYLKEDGWAILKYTIPIAIMTMVGTFSTSVDLLVIRHRLSDFESAGYYMITRFTEIASYFGSAFVIFLFPMVAQLKAKSADSRNILLHSISGTAMGGLSVGVVLYFIGGWVLGLNSLWAPYSGMSRFMFPICLLNVLSLAGSCVITYEMAQGRFRFLSYTITLIGLKCLFLYVATGIGFFQGIMPDAFIAQVRGWNPCTLSFVIGTLLVFQATLVCVMVADVFFCQRKVAVR